MSNYYINAPRPESKICFKTHFKTASSRCYYGCSCFKQQKEKTIFFDSRLALIWELIETQAPMTSFPQNDGHIKSDNQACMSVLFIKIHEIWDADGKLILVFRGGGLNTTAPPAGTTASIEFYRRALNKSKKPRLPSWTLLHPWLSCQNYGRCPTVALALAQYQPPPFKQTTLTCCLIAQVSTTSKGKWKVAAWICMASPPKLALIWSTSISNRFTRPSIMEDTIVGAAHDGVVLPPHPLLWAARDVQIPFDWWHFICPFLVHRNLVTCHSRFYFNGAENQFDCSDEASTHVIRLLPSTHTSTSSNKTWPVWPGISNTPPPQNPLTYQKNWFLPSKREKQLRALAQEN